MVDELKNYNKNKILFKEILNNGKYKIKKESNVNNILYIETENRKIKCKYLMFLIEKKIVNNLSFIIWSDSNPYIDNATQQKSKIIRNYLSKNNNILIDNNQIIDSKTLYNIINDMIKNQLTFDDFKCQWIIINNKDIVEYFMITEVLYF